MDIPVIDIVVDVIAPITPVDIMVPVIDITVSTPIPLIIKYADIPDIVEIPVQTPSLQRYQITKTLPGSGELNVPPDTIFRYFIFIPEFSNPGDAVIEMRVREATAVYVGEDFLEWDIGDTVATKQDVVVHFDTPPTDPSGFNMGFNRLSLDELLEPRDYIWDLRLSFDGGITWGDWEEESAFKVVEQIVHTQILQEFTYWEIAELETAPTPVIWFIDPTLAQPGDRVNIYGFGFGDTPATTVTVDDEDAIIIDLVHYPTDTPREITPSTDVVTQEHEIIGITVPSVDSPGGIIIVNTGD